MVKFLKRQTCQAVEEFFRIPMPQVRHILLHKGIMDTMSTVALYIYIYIYIYMCVCWTSGGLGFVFLKLSTLNHYIKLLVGFKM